MRGQGERLDGLVGAPSDGVHPKKRTMGASERDEFLRAAYWTLVGSAPGDLGDELRISVGHPRIEERQASGLEGILRRFLDDHELSPTGVFLVKGLGG